MQDSEECLNDTYLGAWNSIPPNRPRILQAFLSTIMRHIAIDRYRKKHNKKAIPPALAVSLQDLEGYVLENDSNYTDRDAKALADVISAWIGTLSERQRYIFMSRYYDARSIVEIANIMDCSKSTVNAEISQIKRSLKQALAKEGYVV